MVERTRFSVVMVAAGRGERAGASANGPKQYRLIGGRPVIAHALSAFLADPGCAEVVVVIHPDDAALFAGAASAFADDRRLASVFGGATRQMSSLAGLMALRSDAEFVLIHDAVRPFVTGEIIDGVVSALAAGSEAALSAVAVNDTLKRGDADGFVFETVSRASLFAAQTPQGFRLACIRAAHLKAVAEERHDFTDDCAIAEWAGHKVTLTLGRAGNVKLTTLEDIAMADSKLHADFLPDIRTGNGYDVHRLEAGDHVTLCGVRIPHTLGLNGHSDADVALHALTDALLATCGAGDIGDHFPPSDPQWRGAASSIFLDHAARIVRAAGGTIMNADVSLIAEEPKIGPHRQLMRETLAGILDIALERCSVKATTNEKIGFVGRNEGIAAIATATVAFGPTSRESKR